MNWRTRKAALMMSMVLGVSHLAAGEFDWRQLPPLPDAHGFASPFVGTAAGTLLLAGGANFPDKQLWEGGAKVWHDDVFALAPGGLEWKLIGRLPEPLAYGVSASTEDGLILVGGSNAKEHVASVFLLQWRDGTLTRRELPPLPQPVAMSAGTRVGDVIYLAGGFTTPKDKEPLRAFLALDLKQVEAGWKELPSWPGPGRFQAVAAADGGWFYLFSGIRPKTSGEGLEYLRDAYRYSPEKGWEKLADLPFPAAAAASPAPADEHGIYLMSGVDGSGAGKKPLDFFPVPQRIQVYSPEKNSWSEAGNAPAGRVCVSVAEWGGKWVLPSGERSPGVRSPEVWSLGLPKN